MDRLLGLQCMNFALPLGGIGVVVKCIFSNDGVEFCPFRWMAIFWPSLGAILNCMEADLRRLVPVGHLLGVPNMDFALPLGALPVLRDLGAAGGIPLGTLGSCLDVCIQVDVLGAHIGVSLV